MSSTVGLLVYPKRCTSSRGTWMMDLSTSFLWLRCWHNTFLVILNSGRGFLVFEKVELSFQVVQWSYHTREMEFWLEEHIVLSFFFLCGFLSVLLDAHSGKIQKVRVWGPWPGDMVASSHCPNSGPTIIRWQGWLVTWKKRSWFWVMGSACAAASQEPVPETGKKFDHQPSKKRCD